MRKETEYREKIEIYFPNIPIRSFVPSFDQGLHNDLIFLNGELVIRFGKNDYFKDLLEHEYKVVCLIKEKTDMPVPDMKKLEHGAVYYPFIPGNPLFRHKLLNTAVNKQNKIMDMLGCYLYQLHHIPLREIRNHGISVSPASSEDYREVYKRLAEGYSRIKKELYPYMRNYTRECVDVAFRGLENGELWFEFQPCLIHGDLALAHIILDEDYAKINGIIDFGVAGTGSEAFDMGVMLDNLGEGLTAKMSGSYPGLETLLQRSRVGLSAAHWHLRGLETSDIFWHLVHLMTAKDIKY